MLSTRNLIDQFFAERDASRAKKMSAYMLNRYSFIGIPAPRRRELAYDFLSYSKSLSIEEVDSICRELWRLEEREFQYVAVDLYASRVKKMEINDLNLPLALVADKSWWDTVDGLTGVFSRVLRRYPVSESELLFNYCVTHPNLWFNRVAICHQLGWGNKTDQARLFHACRILSGHNDFFVRKAIGWALRDFSKHDPQAVSTFVDENKSKLSNLTIREALKNLNKSKLNKSYKSK